MTRRTRLIARAAIALAGLGAAMLPAGVAQAHEEREVGELTLVVGWATEPAYAGFGNEVQVIVEQGNRPLEGAELEAEVIFGDPESQTRTGPLPLEPAFETPNEYLGYIIPTRPGTYSFHVTGTAGEQDVDEVFTSGPDTFDDVNNPTDAEFPEQDPTRGELAEALDRLSGRIEQLRAEVAADDDESPVALWVAIGAGVVALIALLLAARRRTT
jgi:hypothetical protein